MVVRSDRTGRWFALVESSTAYGEDMVVSVRALARVEKAARGEPSELWQRHVNVVHLGKCAEGQLHTCTRVPDTGETA